MDQHVVVEGFHGIAGSQFIACSNNNAITVCHG